MRGLVIVSKYKYGQEIARYRQKVYKCNILMEMKISFAKYLKTAKKRIANCFTKFNQMIRWNKHLSVKIFKQIIANYDRIRM